MQHVEKFGIPTRFNVFAALIATLAFLCTGLAHADEYADVTQMAKQGRAAEALAKADAYIASKPRDPQMRFLRGVILTEQGKQADATAAFVQLTQEFPELPEPYNNLAGLYAAQSQFDQARAALETAIRLNPSYATAHENLGDVYVRLAAQSYARAQQLDKGNKSISPKLVTLREVFLPKPVAKPVPAAKPGDASSSARPAATSPSAKPVESAPAGGNTGNAAEVEPATTSPVK